MVASVLLRLGRAGLAALLLGIGSATASPPQDVRLTDLPPEGVNTRFFAPVYASRHPGLTFNGFDCTTTDRCGQGLGLKQVLERVFRASPDPLAARDFSTLLEYAQKPLFNPAADRAEHLQNTLRTQARGVVALSSLILERNGYTPEALSTLSGIEMPTSSAAHDAFVHALRLPNQYRVIEALSDEAIKWTTLLMNLTRAVDLYLGYERAALHYGLPADDLLSCPEKSQLLLHLDTQLRAVDRLGNLDAFFKGSGLNYDEVQSGNWPMKVHISVGYATLAQQQGGSGACILDIEDEKYEHWLRRGLRSAGKPAPGSRSSHWYFQSAGGRRFWGEGPFYFHYMLSELLPFWHAIRTNDLLDVHPEFTLTDPFFSYWFTQPLEWFADLVTPDGMIPPLDDGNKVIMDHVTMLRWDDTYGDAELGRKFAWINETVGVVNIHLTLNSLVIPRTLTARPPDPVVATGPEAPPLLREQQLIVRRDGGSGACNQPGPVREGNCHYILLNGESEAAIRPGEGHEQSDQLQLIYYVNGTSYLVDSGYDDSAGIQISSWNLFPEHNVLSGVLTDDDPIYGGIEGPLLDFICPCQNANHQGVRALHHTASGRVDVLHAEIDLMSGHQDFAYADYRRTVLFIDDPDRPYLIDVNGAADYPGVVSGNVAYTMRYHVNSPETSDLRYASDPLLWYHMWEVDAPPFQEARATPNHLLLQPFRVEYATVYDLVDDVAREPFLRDFKRGDGLPIRRVDIPGFQSNAQRIPSHTTVAFLRALPEQEPDAAAEAARIVPSELRAYPSPGTLQTPLLWQAYTWQLDENTVDLVAVRTAAVFQDPSLSSDEWIVPLQGDDLRVLFPKTSPVAFARFRRNETGTWRIDPDYQTGDFVVAETVPTEQPAVAGRDVALLANYPNPFSGSTTLEFDLNRPGEVRLDIYDTRGRRVASLVDRFLTPGRYRSVWRPETGLPSGVYFARLQAGDRTQTQPMLFVR